MKFKKTITLAILAAVLSANLASCVTDRDPKDTGESYTEDGSGALPIDPDNKAQDDEYQDVNLTVYAIYKSTLDPVDGAGASVTVEIATELTVIAQSSTWYKVRYYDADAGQEKIYFIARGRTTDEDLGEKSFVSCSKTMYATGGLNVRYYPSSNNKYSKIVGTLAKGDAVTVIAESVSSNWCKVEYTDGNTKVKGFVWSGYLSTRSDGSKDYEDKFTTISDKTVYVSVESMANLREEPYLPDDNGEGGGSLVVGAGVARGTQLTAIAEGTVDGVAWYQVWYKKDENSKSVKCYITKSSVSEVKPKDSYTVDELITEYRYTSLGDNGVTAYPYDTSINIRETPSKSGKSLGSVYKTALTVYAYGKSSNGDATWCVIKTSDGIVGFASYDFLTLDPTGKTMSAIPLSLEHLVSVYGFTTLTKSTTGTAGSKGVNLWGTPDSEAVLKTVASGTSVEIVATGKIGPDDAYIVKVDGTYYFALKSAFN